MAWCGVGTVQKTLTQTVQGTPDRFNKAKLRCLPVGPIYICIDSDTNRYPNIFLPKIWQFSYINCHTGKMPYTF